jgi:hypothetical protein
MDNIQNLSILIIILIGIIALQTYLIQIIFNKVVITKFPSANIKELSFWDALAISVLCSLLSCCPRMINY